MKTGVRHRRYHEFHATGIPAGLTATSRTTPITNLLEGCCVEVPCLVDKEGVHPCYVGNLPPQCACLNQNSVFIQELTVRGVVEKTRTKSPRRFYSTR